MPEGSVDSIISSPPYAESIKGDHAEQETAQESRAKRRTQGGSLGQSQRHGGYGVSDGQLGAMREGSVDGIISSPPYAETINNQSVKSCVKSVEQRERYNLGGGQLSNPGSYGTTPGQLGSMKEGAVDAVVSSPPYETGGHHKHQMDSWNTNGQGQGTSKEEMGYGTHPAQLGGDTFWTAARQIVQQCHTLLKPGGHAIWIVKDYVKAKKIVPFCDNWKRMCESIGFVTACEHRTMLVKDLGVETNLFEPPKPKTKEHKSFFRRLAEKKGSPRIDWEMVICMEKS
jgi:DNA modification methylase